MVEKADQDLCLYYCKWLLSLALDIFIPGSEVNRNETNLENIRLE